MLILILKLLVHVFQVAGALAILLSIARLFLRERSPYYYVTFGMWSNRLLVVTFTAIGIVIVLLVIAHPR